MPRLPLLAALPAVALCACWWGPREVATDTGWLERPSDDPDQGDDPQLTRSEFFNPDWWTLEIWGYHDGQRLTEFQYHSASSGQVPAFAILRFTDTRWDEDEQECYWAGSVEIQGWTTLTEDQYDAWGFTLELTDTTCGDFDSDIWLSSSPTWIIENHYYSLAFRPPSSELDAALTNDTDGPMSWAKWDDDVAKTLQLGFEREQGEWEHFMAGAAYALMTEGDIVVWSPTGRPYPVETHGDMSGHVVAAGSLFGLDVGLFF